MAHIAHDEDGTPCIVDSWNLYYFRMAAEHIGLDLNDTQLIAGMERVVEDYDVNIGITFEVIQDILLGMYEEISSC